MNFNMISVECHQIWYHVQTFSDRFSETHVPNKHQAIIYTDDHNLLPPANYAVAGIQGGLLSV